MPSYQATLAPIIIEAIAMTPAIRGAPHFIKRATRIALLIRWNSARSGLTGRSIQAKAECSRATSKATAKEAGRSGVGCHAGLAHTVWAFQNP